MNALLFTALLSAYEPCKIVSKVKTHPRDKIVVVFEKHRSKIVASYTAAYAAVLYYVSSFHPLISWDGFFYIRYTMDSVFPPVYPMFIAIFNAILGNEETAAKLVSALYMMGSTVVVYHLAKQFVPALWAFIAMLVFSLNPLSLRLAVVTYSESTYVFFMLLTFYFFGVAMSGHRMTMSLVLAGLAGGMAMQTRPEALVFFVPLVAWFLYARRKYLPALQLTGAFAGVVLLSTFITYLYTGDFTLTRKTSNLRVAYSTYEWEKNEAMKTGAARDATPENVVASMFDNYSANILGESKDIIRYAGIPLLLVALYGIVKHPNYLLVGFIQFFVYPFVSGLGAAWRFVFPYIPFLVLFAVLGIALSVKGMTRIVLVTLILFGVIGEYRFAVQSDEPFVELKYAGTILQAHVNKDTRIIDKKPHSAFYAGLRTSQYIETPILNLAQLYEYAKKHQATLLVASKRVTFTFRRQQMDLFHPQRRMQWAEHFQPYLTFFEGEPHEVRVFRIL